MNLGRCLLRHLLSGALVLLVPSSSPAAEAVPDGALGIQRDGGTFRLTITGEDGREYSVEAIEAFLNQNAGWRSVARVAPAQGPAFLYDPTCSTRPQSFYRLRLVQGSVPVEVPNFRLIDLEGHAHELYYQTDVRAVVLVLAGADLASLADVLPSLQALQGSLDPAQVRLWILTAATAADRTRTREKASALGLASSAVILEDEGGVVTRQLGRGTVPETVVIDPSRYAIVYRGRIEDAPAVAGGAVRQPLLAQALTQHLARQPVVIRDTEVAGLDAGLPAVGAATYDKDIAPLLREHCVKCHSPGNIAPWAMTGHGVVRDFAPLMKDEVLTRRMPPWHADRQAQHYSNDEMLSAEDLAMLVDWIDRGAPRGDWPDPLAEEVPPPPPAWPLGAPDRVVAVEAQQIPASGTVDYRYLVLPNPFGADVWLRAAVVKPGNPRVVHHVLVFSASSVNDLFEIRAGLGGYFAAYVPGMAQDAFPEGTGKLLKKGAFLVFQLHYTATGQPETDATELGLYVAEAPPARELRTAAAYDLDFTIPPRAPNHPASAEFRLPRDATVYEFSPHMHYRGRWFRFEAAYPDGRRETLLNVPFYRFDWQTLYRLAEPKRLPAGTRIVVTGGWDNSARNPYNPDPAATVTFGEQSWEEMFIGYFNWADSQ